MKATYYIPVASLQLFAEGGADGGTAQGQGVTAGAASQQTTTGDLSTVQYGVQAPAAGEQTKTTAEPADPSAEFEKLIKGQYKQQYDQRVQNTVRQRLKGTQETVDKYNALQPVLEILGKKHGVDASDVNALRKAIEADDSYFEQEAMEMGMSVENLKKFKAIQRENESLRQADEQRKQKESADKLYAGWMDQAEQTKKIYPTFDFKAEMANEKFVDLIRSNIDVRTAYEVLHKDEIIPAAMQFAAQKVQSNIAKSIASGGSRPTENGAGSSSAAVVRSDVSKLTYKDIDEINRRVSRGERVSFS
jgi:hypothetical protein